MDIRSTLIKILEEELADMQSEIRKQFDLQGHRNTGSLINSVNFRVEQRGTEIIGVVEFNDYGRYVNTGVKAVNIPFKRGSGRKSSKYIDALISFFRGKGLNEEDSKRAAFATAIKQKKEGMPTNSSKRFSRNGKRVGAVNDAVNKIGPRLESKLEAEVENFVIASIDVKFQELQNVA